MHRTAALSICAALFLGLSWYVIGVAPTVPLLDQWTLFELYHAMATGQATWVDFLEPHNGAHVIPLPRLFLAGLAFATDWSLAAESWASLLIVIATFVGVIRIVRSTAGAQDAFESSGFVLTALLLCSPAAYWSWVWGCGFFHFLMNACAVFGALALVGGSVREQPSRLIWAGAWCTLATFTRAEGLGLWLVLAPLVVLRTEGMPQRRRVLLAWFCGAALCTLLVASSIVFLGERLPTKPLEEMSVASAVRSGVIAFSLIGYPLGVGLATSIIGGWKFGAMVPALAPVGALVALAFGALALRLLRDEDPATRRLAWAWIGIGALGAAFAVVIGAMRAGVLEKGFLHDFWPSNYAPTTTLFSLATVQLAVLAARRIRGRIAPGVTAGLVAAGALLALVFVTKLPDALHGRTNTQIGSLCWEVYYELDDLNWCFINKLDDVYAVRMEEAGFRSARDDLTYDRETRGLGAIESRGERRAGGDEAYGWVRGSDGEDPHVFISLDGRDRIFAPAEITGWDGDRASWRADLFRQPPGTRIEAWRYDRSSGRFERLDGELVVGG